MPAETENTPFVLDDFIAQLQAFRETYGGQLRIAMAKDPEGNAFHTLEPPYHSFANIENDELAHVDDDNAQFNTLVLWPSKRLRD